MSADAALPPTSLLQLLHRTATTLRRRVQSQVLAPEDITWPQYEVLHVLRGRGATPGEVAAITGITKPSLAATLTRLEAFRLIARDVDPTDRRVSRLRLTAVGARLTDTLDRAVQDAEDTLFAALDPTTRASLRHLLHQISE